MADEVFPAAMRIQVTARLSCYSVPFSETMWKQRLNDGGSETGQVTAVLLEFVGLNKLAELSGLSCRRSCQSGCWGRLGT